MRKLFSLFMALLATTSLWAEDFSVGGIYYNYLDGNNVEVTYRGSRYDSYSNEYSGSVEIPATVYVYGTTYNVTSIGEDAFYKCTSLKSITIPESVTTIESSAFSNCSSLRSITIPESVTTIESSAFYNCTSLQSITIPENVTSIGYGAFVYCSSLNSVVWNAKNCTITDHIGDVFYTLFYLSYLDNYSNVCPITSFIFGNEVEYIPEQLCYCLDKLTSVTIPNSVTSIGFSAFSRCSGLTSITIPNSVTSIGGGAFSDCSSLTSITIPNSVTSIGRFIFSDCSSLTSITIPNSVTSIGYNAFSGCFSLTSITIPNSVTSIGEQAFSLCSSLNSITLPNSVTSIGSSAFYWCSSLTSIAIPNSVTSIGKQAFSGCSSLSSIVVETGNTTYDSRDKSNAIIETATNTLVIGCKNTIIPNSVTSIGDYAFSGCSSLTSITIPESVMTIEHHAFSDCSSLNSITLPNSVTSIGDNAFYWCSSLQSITCKSETPPTIYNSTFENVSTSIPVHVPCGTIDTYNASTWNYFSNIQELLLEYAIVVSSIDNKQGSAKLDKNSACGSVISATANTGYHFTQWSDGNLDNPRTFIPTQDTTFIAEFAPDRHTISAYTSDSERGTVSGGSTADYGSYVTITATANYGYHFTCWDDGNTDNPRRIQVTKDISFTAYFDKNTYYITTQCDDQQGFVSGPSISKYLDTITLTASANYGYHFAQWSDGKTDNPRSLVLTQDTVLTAEFAPNTYTISTQCNYTERGTTSGDVTTTYLDYVTISATANYGYHFSHWDDYNYDNPRQVQVTEDKTYTAYFDKNTYYITKNYDSNQGYVDGYSSGEYLDNITLIAEPNYGYHFVRWADGNTDNPRHFILTQDTTFSAEFAQTFSGQCGDNLYWSYQNDTLTISGFGGMYDNRPWGLFTNEIQTVVLPNGITHIGNDAFSDCTGLNEITIPYTVTSIGDYAFAGCKKLVHVNCYAINPPMAESTSFANYNVYLNVPCDNLQDYQLDMVFGSFKYIQCMGADSENVPTDDVVITPGTNDVTITWPTEGNADTYTIVIKKGNEVFCTLTFNAEGQLLNIAFAPGRNGNRPAQYAEQTVNGYRFTVTSLESGTKYGYNIDVKDASNKTIKSHSGEFTTQSTTAVDNITTKNANIQKIIRDGQFIIVRDGVEYNAMGQEM